MARRRKHAERWICFKDEAPRIGSGWRPINVLSIGPKWVKIEGHGSLRRARIKRAVWDALLAARANAGG